MPLPDAEPTPNKANIYEQFSSIKVVNFTVDNLDVVRKPLFLNAQSEDVLRRLNLLSQVTNSQSTSGAIPKTQKIITQAFTDSGATNLVIFTPEKGQVWSISAGSYSSTGGTSRLFLFLKDNVNNISMEIADESASSGQHNSLDPFNAPGFLIDENCSLVASVSVTDSTSSNVYFSASRVR